MFINGEELPIQFPSLGDTVWAVFDLKGQCYELSVTSHKAPPPSPMNRWITRCVLWNNTFNFIFFSARLQDSLEVLEHEQAPIELEECNALTSADIPPGKSNSVF